MGLFYSPRVSPTISLCHNHWEAFSQLRALYGVRRADREGREKTENAGGKISLKDYNQIRFPGNVRKTDDYVQHTKYTVPLSVLMYFLVSSFFVATPQLSGVLCLPPGITVLLSLTVFMLMVAEIMPATSDSVPLIGQFLFLSFSHVCIC